MMPRRWFLLAAGLVTLLAAAMLPSCLGPRPVASRGAQKPRSCRPVATYSTESDLQRIHEELGVYLVLIGDVVYNCDCADGRLHGGGFENRQHGAEAEERMHGDGAEARMHAWEGEARLRGEGAERLFGGETGRRLHGEGAEERAFGGEAEERMHGAGTAGSTHPTDAERRSFGCVPLEDGSGFRVIGAGDREIRFFDGASIHPAPDGIVRY